MGILNVIGIISNIVWVIGVVYWVLRYWKERSIYFKIFHPKDEALPQDLKQRFEELFDRLLTNKTEKVSRQPFLNVGMTYTGEKRTFFKVHTKGFDRQWTGSFADKGTYEVSIDWLLKIMLKLKKPVNK